MNHELNHKMDHKTAFFLKILLNRRHKGDSSSLLKMLPAEKSDLLSRETTIEDNISHALVSPSDALSTLHYSWIAEKLTDIPLAKQRLYIACLPTSFQDPVCRLLNVQKPENSIKGPLKRILQKELLQLVFPENHLAQPYLPKSTLNPLLQAPKTKITQLVDFLGLFDLAEEMKKIVDTKLLKNLYLSLPPKQQEFLKLCMHQKDQLQSPRFPLKDWSGEAKDLQAAIHKRGLIRLSKAISGQPPLIIWHIVHKLDTGRGKKLEQLLTKEELPQITAILTAQVLQLLRFLDKA